MRQVRLKEGRAISESLGRSRGRALIAGMLASGVVLVAAVRAYNHSTARAVNITRSSASLPAAQGSLRSQRDSQSRLAFQPEADRFRRGMGKRFTDPGREHATQIGTLKIGTQQFQVRIDRTQDEDGEQVDVSLNGGGGSLTWNGKDGARSAGRDAAGQERALIERIALDSPDQFVFAQLRGASYYTIARSVAPAGSAESDAAPLWDLVRIVEPQHGTGKKPQNEWRIYYINTITGLIDKILYQDQGQNIAVEMSGWANRGGEKGPSLIRWSRDGNVEMELSFNSLSHGPR